MRGNTGLTAGVQATTIDWKDESKNLTKQHPRVQDEDDDELPAEGGSLFNFFEVAEDPFDVRSIFILVVSAVPSAHVGACRSG